MNRDIARAPVEQDVVAAAINENIHGIVEMSSEKVVNAEKAKHQVENLNEIAMRISNLTNQFKVRETMLINPVAEQQTRSVSG